MNRLRTDGLICQATVPDNLETILDLERSPENSPFIRQWSREQHEAAIHDPNVSHITVYDETSGQLLGYVILIGISNQDQNLEFKRIVIANKGKGIGRKAVRMVKQLAFEEYGVHRLWLEVMFNNARARRLYKTEGFQEEGVHRECMKVGNSFVDLLVMSMLEQEYSAGDTN